MSNDSENENRPQVLIVDDSRVIRLGAKKMLGEAYEVQLAEDGEQAWSFIRQSAALAVVFTDLNMPKMDGMALLKKIRNASDKRIAALPVVILSGSEDDSNVKQQAMEAGATDFIFKPFDSVELNSRARSYAQLSRKLVELEKNSAYDSLTGLYNEKSLREQGEKAVSFANRHRLCVGLALIEVKHLQEYRIKYGGRVAQTILISVVKRLNSLLREEDIAARVSASRFALIISMADADRSRVAIERLRRDIQKLVFEIGHDKVKLSLNIGYTALHEGEKLAFDELYQQAETAISQLDVTGEGQLAYHSGYVPDPEGGREEIVKQAVQAVLDGRFADVPGHLIDELADRFGAFLQYCGQQPG